MPAGKENESMKSPLGNIRLLDLSQALSGPASSRMMADLGAQVIKVEPPKVGEAARNMGASFIGGESVYYMIYNRNKKGITIDLRTDEGRQVFYDLVRISDVVLDNFRPGVTARLGVDYGTLKKVNPTIICCSISGFGKDGPYKNRPVFDSVAQATAGAMSVTGEPGGPPAVMGFAVADIGASYGASVGILAALLARERTGEGCELDLSLLDVHLTFQGHLAEMYLGSGRIPTAGGSVQSANLPNGAFKTSDQRYLQIHCATQKFYEELASAIAAEVEGFEGLPADPRFTTIDGRRKNWEQLRDIIESALATKTADEWILLLAERLPVAKINNIREAYEDPQVLHRNMLVEAEHPTAGRYQMPGNPVKFGEEAFGPAPTLGQHNEEVLSEVLGYTAGRIDDLRHSGAI